VKIHLESTSKIVTFNGIECRIWEGKTEAGVPMHAYIARVAIDNNADASQFEAELREAKPPTADVAAIPFRMLID